jgi:class 3 adenylate cyclase/tetratricopeptide (TPR) repeat protein
MTQQSTRQLAIMFTDLVGYSRMMGDDERQAFKQLETYRRILSDIIETHHGTVVEFAGDAIFARFNTATEAVDAGMDIQRSLHRHNSENEGHALQSRIGVHYGEVQVKDGDLYGDDINIAARLEPLCDAEGICISKSVRDELNSARLKHCVAFGRPALKNISGRFSVYQLFPEPINWRKRVHLTVRRGRRYFSDHPAISYPIVLAALVAGVFILAPVFFNPVTAAHYVELGEIKNLNPDEMPEYYTIGIADEIQTRLKDIPNLYVTKPEDEVGAEVILTGSVQQMAQQVRLAYRLARREGGVEIGGASLNGRLEDMLDLQAQLADKVAADISSEFKLKRVESKQTGHEVDPEAYQYYLQARDYASRPDDDRSLETTIHLYKGAIKLDSEFSAAYAGLCQAYWARYEFSQIEEDIQQAEDACNKAQTLDPNSAEFHIALGDVKAGHGLWKQAITEYNNAIRVDPKNIDAFINLADVYNDKNDHKLAEQTYRRAIRMHPGQWEAWSYYGKYQFNQGDYNGAIKSFKKVVDLTPDNSKGYASLGGVYLYNSQFKQAADAFNKQSQLRPNSQTILNAGTMHYYDGDYFSAAEMYRKAIEMDPDFCGYWGNLSDALLMINEKKGEARAAAERDLTLCEQALAVNPVDYDVLINKASSLSKLGRNQDAVDTITTALAIAPNNPQVWLYSSLVHLRKNDMKNARSSLEQAVEGGYPHILIRAEPAFNPIRNEEWYQSLIQKEQS